MPNLTEDENNDFENNMARDALEKVKTFQNSHAFGDLKVNFFQSPASPRGWLPGCEYEEEGYDGGWEEEEIEEKVV